MLKNKIGNVTAIGLAILLLSACTTAPEQDAAYVAPTQYDDFNCKQISAQMRLVSSRMDQASAADSTNQLLGAAVTAYAISQGYGYGTSDDTNMRRLKNQYSVLQETAIRKQCGMK